MDSCLAGTVQSHHTFDDLFRPSLATAIGGRRNLEAYDPDLAPVAEHWLALSEMQRIDLVEEFHSLSGNFGESLRAHSAIHAVVENQLALGQPIEAQAALARLLRGGVTRHDAIHAIGSVLAEHLFPVLQEVDDPPEFNQRSYVRGLANLTARQWRSGG
jgi:hypothetical protein